MDCTAGPPGGCVAASHGAGARLVVASLVWPSSSTVEDVVVVAADVDFAGRKFWWRED